MKGKINLDIQVIDKEMDRPIRGATVTIKGHTLTKESKAIGGKASFEDLEQGLYLIRATASGYKDSVFSLGLRDSGSFSVLLARSQLPF